MTERELITALGELHAVQSVTEMVDWTLNELGERFGCDFCVWTAFNGGGEMRSAVFGKKVDAGVWKYGPVMARHQRREHPTLRRFFAEHGRVQAGRVSDFESQSRIREMVIYRDGYRHFGMQRQLSSIFAGPGGTIGTFSFGRSGSEYSDAQARAISELTLHFQLAFTRLWRIEALEEARVLSFRAMRALGGWYYAVATDAVLRRVEEVFGREREPCRAPAELERQIERALAGHVVVARPAQGPGWRVGVSRLNAREVMVFLSPQGAEALSPREREVLRWIAAGKRDAEIALILGIAARTVGKHVENILTKLGCENRTAAVASYFQDNGAVRGPGDGI